MYDTFKRVLSQRIIINNIFFRVRGTKNAHKVVIFNKFKRQYNSMIICELIKHQLNHGKFR